MMKRNLLIVLFCVLVAIVAISCDEAKNDAKIHTVTVKHAGEVTLPDEVTTVVEGEKYTIKTYAIEGYSPSISDGYKSGDEITVNSDIVITVTWTSNPGTFFASGSGTKNDPYVIKNEHQFVNIYHLSEAMASSKENYYYFSVVNDLDFTSSNESPFIPVFRGEIDFNGHTVKGITNSLLNSKMTQTQRFIGYNYLGFEDAYGLINGFVCGKISDLTLIVSDYLKIVAYGNYLKNGGKDSSTTIEFSKVKVTSDGETIVLADNETNFSGFISQCLGGKLILSECVNEASYMGGKYGSAFVGGYAKDTEVTFEKCTNKGNITTGKVGFLIGNYYYNNTTTLIAKNCSNEGNLLGTEDAGYLSWGNKDFKAKTLDSNTGEDKVKKLETISGVAVTTGEDNVFTVSYSGDNYASFKIVGSTYRTYYSGDDKIGTHLYSVSSDVFKKGDATEFKKLGAIDLKAFAAKPTVTKDKYGNDTVVKDGTTYYYNDSTPSKVGKVESNYAVIGTQEGGYKATLTYTLYAYDNNGSLIGSMKI